MLCLRDLQEQFAQALFSGVDAPIANVIEAGSLDSSARLGIYRNNVLSNYRNALRDTYPVILRLVGDEFFNAAARVFAKQSSSASGDLNDYGEEFGAFLAAFPPAQGLPYLADVARLEWAVHRVFHSADAEPLALSRFAEFSEDELPRLRFTLNPASRLLESSYPITRIWQAGQAEQAGGESEVSLEDGGERVLVLRQASYGIHLKTLAQVEHVMLHALASGLTLGEAVDKALAVHADFNLGAFLSHHTRESTFMAIQI
ncbi:MAG: DUF2063 domain-containing protein [Burkholderiales bacterium]